MYSLTSPGHFYITVSACFLSPLLLHAKRLYDPLCHTVPYTAYLFKLLMKRQSVMMKSIWFGESWVITVGADNIPGTQSKLYTVLSTLLHFSIYFQTELPSTDRP